MKLFTEFVAVYVNVVLMNTFTSYDVFAKFAGLSKVFLMISHDKVLSLGINCKFINVMLLG